MLLWNKTTITLVLHDDEREKQDNAHTNCLESACSNMHTYILVEKLVQRFEMFTFKAESHRCVRNIMCWSKEPK